jgi:UDP-N-acetyl-D-mannosaminuronic acid dehydrogenase
MSKEKVCIVGLGYIGLPTSILMAINGLEVFGMDVNKSVVEQTNRAQLSINEPGLQDLLTEAIDSKLLSAHSEVQAADTYLIVVPTPFKNNNEPDISYVENAAESLTPLLKEHDLVIIESTCPKGTTEKIADNIYGVRPELKGKLNIAYCPERVLPGNIIHELVHNDRVIGGIDDKSTARAIAFYKQFVKGALYPTNARTAEMTKLVENAYRDVQIAFANELSIICDKADINVWELISLASKHPRVNILNPGCGVGGHCIAVDPYFIVAEYPLESKIIGKAREINNYKAIWCTKKIDEAITKFYDNHNRKPVVGMMGLAYKPNIDDLRESPALFITREILKNYGSDLIKIVEPNLSTSTEFELTDYTEAAEKADIIVYLVSHNEFKDLAIGASTLVLDFCGITQSVNQ